MVAGSANALAVNTKAATALKVKMARISHGATSTRFCLVHQPKAGQRHAGQANAEFLQRAAAGDGLGHCFGKFVELVIHI